MRITKLIAAVAGTLAIVAGFGMTLAGGLAVAVPDSDGWVTAGPVRISTDAAALVGRDIEIDLGSEVTDGRTFVRWDAIPAQVDVASRNGKDVFVGIAPQGIVETYLSGVSIGEVDVFHHEMDLDSTLGSAPAPIPTEQEFWVASSVDGTLDWDIDDGDWAVVVVNADGSPGIDVAVTGSAHVPFLRAIGVGLLIGGVTALIVGAVLVYFGVRPVRAESRATPQEPLTA